MTIIINELKSLISFYFVLLVIAIGLFTFFVDGKSFKKKKLKGEEKLAKLLGLIYIIGGPVLYLFLKII